MKTENLKWCVDKVGWDAPDTSDTEAAQKALAAYSELIALVEAHKALSRACTAVVYRQGDADSREALARDALRKAGVPL